MSTATLSCQQIRDIDRRAVEEYGMSSLVLMENAGRGLADNLCQVGVSGPVVICCGTGNNGGDGLVMARHLDSRLVTVRVCLFGDVAKLTPDALANYHILERCDVSIEHYGMMHDPAQLDRRLQGAGYIVDALLGTGARGSPRAPLDTVIEQLNAHPVPKFAVDLPSGLDGDTGQSARQTIRARHTCTFVAPKRGFAASGAADYLGEVHVLSIGAPRCLIEAVLRQTQP